MNAADAGGANALILAVALLLCSTSSSGEESAASAGGGPATLAVSPRRIPVTSSFHGSTLAVDIAVPSGSEVTLKLEGTRGKAVFNRKGRIFFLWMNVGEVTIDNAPQAYMLYTSAHLTELASPETLRRLGLGLQALEPRIETLWAGGRDSP